MFGFIKKAAAFALTAAVAASVQLPSYARWDKKVISCVGDSITFGTNSNWDEFGNGETTTQALRDQFSYPAKLQKYLGTDGFSVGNYGMGGTTVTDGAGYAGLTYWSDTANDTTKAFHKMSLDSKPDVVIMMFGTNDAGESRVVGSGYTEDDGSFSDTKFKAAFKAGYQTLIDEYKALDTKPELYLMTTPHVGDTDSRMRYLVNPTVREIAAENKIGLIDLEVMLPIDYTGTSDYVHLNKGTYDKAAQLVARQLKAEHMNFDTAVKSGKNVLTLSSDYSFDKFDLYLAAYKDGKMIAAKKSQAIVGYGADKDLNLDWAYEAGADSVRVMTWTDNEPVTPGRRLSLFETMKNPAGAEVIGGTSFKPGEDVTLLVRDAENKIVFADQTTSGADGAFSFIAGLGEGDYTVTIGNSQSGALVRTLNLE